MPRSSHPQLLTTLDQLDRQLREHPRQHAQILDLEAFRRYFERASRKPTVSQTATEADAQTTDTETQLRHELNLAFTDLGAATFVLAHHGALNEKRLAAHVHRIHQLYTQLDALPHTTLVTPPANAAAEHAPTA